MKYKIVPILLSLTLLLTVPAAAATLGEQVDGCSAVLADGLTLTEGQYWTGKDLCTEHYLTLEPGSAAKPAVVSSRSLWARQSLQSAAATQSERILAGCNGGFFTVATGEPVGLVISGGAVRADDGALEAVGFLPDGSTLFGRPEICISLTDGTQQAEISALNRSSGAGLRLYTADCAEKITPAAESFRVLCDIDGELRPGGSARLTVSEISESAEPVLLSDGRALLVLDRERDGAEQSLPELLQPGAELTLEITCAPGWEQVDSAVGILYPLLRAGEIVSGLETYAAPRTAVGVKADGTLVLYTVDGRQSGYSAGTGLLGVARRLRELGCVTAGALDGGGSTVMAAQMPGDDFLSTVNRPSENRSVVNYIFVGTEQAPTGTAARLTLYPLHINAVTGAEIPLTVKAADRGGCAAPVPQNVSYTVSDGLGEVRGGVFHAAGSGRGTIRVSAPGVESAEIPVLVSDSPDTLELYGEKYGKHTTSLTLEPGQEVDLTVRASHNHVALTGDDGCYTWTLDAAAGTVDETGHLVPADVSGSGMLTARVGESSVQIPIRIWTGIPFSDVKPADPCFAAVKYVYEHGVFEGTGETTFDPAVVMSRGMLVTVLWRMSGKPEADPAAFADVAADAWYGPAVAWAAETGLVNGYSETRFAPADDLTQEQILTILHRWSGLPEAKTTAPETVKGVAEAHEYAVPALCWAAESGVAEVSGEGLKPLQPMSRADVAGVLMRWLELPAEK